MKTSHFILEFLLLLILAGCSGVQIPFLNLPTRTPTPTLTASPEPTATITITPTITPTFTQTPLPTITLTPTQTPINFVLADTGYDIADVRLSYPRPDMLTIDFKYRLDESVTLNNVWIFTRLAPRCGEYNYGPTLNYMPDALIGAGKFVFKLTREGTCLGNSLEFNIETFENTFTVVYQETIPLTYELTRDFPAVSLKNLNISKFRFEAEPGWRGKFTLEYELSERIPMPPEQYHFAIRATDQYSRCEFMADGPTLTEYGGIYTINVDAKAQPTYGDGKCLDEFAYSGFTYTQIWVMLIDELTGDSVYFITPNFSFKVFATR